MKWIFLLLSFLSMAADAAPPTRIVSANLCADRLLLPLVGRARIVSLSRFANDPALSTLGSSAAGLPLNHADAEEILAFHPDLVVLGSYTDKAAALMLQRLGIPIYRLPVPSSLSGMRQLIRDLAVRVEAVDAGEAMIQAFDARLAALPRPPAGTRVVLYTSGGWSDGAGSLGDDLLRQLGLRNLTADAGLRGGGVLPLETLVAEAPDWIIVQNMVDSAPSLAEQLLDHPALRGGSARRMTTPLRLWACADPALADAATMITEVLR